MARLPWEGGGQAVKPCTLSDNRLDLSDRVSKNQRRGVSDHGIGIALGEAPPQLLQLHPVIWWEWLRSRRDSWMIDPARSVRAFRCWTGGMR